MSVAFVFTLLHSHIFFNKQQFHNHNPHILLASAALGASSEALRKMYDIHITYQKALIAPRYEINDQNFSDYLFEDEAYSSYLAFFDKKLETMSIEEAFMTYATKEPIFDNLFTGLFHPLIHYCYGVEFSEKLVAAEGLAMACVHAQDRGFRVQALDSMEYMHLKGKSVNEILEDIRNDPVLNSIKYDTGDNFASIATPEASNSLLKHVAHWQVAGKGDVCVI
jgi:Questin oxidase-like